MVGKFWEMKEKIPPVNFCRPMIKRGGICFGISNVRCGENVRICPLEDAKNFQWQMVVGKLKFSGPKPSPLGKVARRSRDGRGQYEFTQTNADRRDGTATSSVKNKRFLPAIVLWYDCHRQSLKCQFPAGASPKGEALGAVSASALNPYFIA